MKRFFLFVAAVLVLAQGQAAALVASAVYELLGEKGMDTDLYPGTNVGIIKGKLAFRQHDGGHESGPNWPYFLDFFDKYVVKK